MAEGEDHKDDQSETRSIDGIPLPGSGTPFQHLGTFRIEETIGSGGMGTVCRAYDESMKRHVALKILHHSLEISTTAQQRFAREAWIAGQLDHANVIKIYSRGQERGVQFVAMELADGGSLAEFIRRSREEASGAAGSPITQSGEYIRSMLSRCIPLCDALEHIHNKGFIHRDIKPHNILLSGPDKAFKLTDFGIAHSESMTKVTRAGDFIGTIKYMSPELLTAHRATVDKRTDIYSLGVTLYELLTLSLPFDGDSEEKYISEILSGHLVPARRRNQSIPRDLETVLLKATQQDPDRRYQSAAELGEDLRRVLENRPVKARRASVASRLVKSARRHRTTFIAAPLLIVLVAVAGYLLVSRQNLESERRSLIKTMRASVAAKRPPQELDPGWPQMSQILARTLAKSKTDSVAMWFFRLNELIGYTYQNPFSPTDTPMVSCWNRSFLLFDSPSGRDSTPLVMINIVDLAVDSGPFQPWVLLGCQYVFDHDAGRMATSSKLSQFMNPETGTHLLTARAISFHYANAGIFEPLPYDHQSGGQSLRRPPNTHLQITPGGDSLLGHALGYAFGATAPYSTSHQILDLTTLRPSQPIFTDTVIDTVSFTTVDSRAASSAPASTK